MQALVPVSAAMKYTVGIVVLLVGLGVLGICAREAHHWRSGRTVIDKAQLGLRFAGAGLMLAILGMILFGVLYAESLTNPVVFVSFWMVCMALAVALFVVALIDLRRLARKQRAHEKELCREFAEIIRQEVAKRRGESPSSEESAGDRPAGQQT